MKIISIIILFIFIIYNINANIIINNDIDNNNNNNQNKEIINAFLIPHSHCDVGWLETVEEYFSENVTLILDNVVHTLINDPTKKFNWAEIVYFERWWNDQTPLIQSQVRNLVSNKQLYFIGGGWTQNDEAVIHYEAVINQMTLGHQFLLSTFGFVPEIGWQIDPFGPSSLTPNLFALMGFKYHVINRIDQRLKYIYNDTYNPPNIPNSGIMTTDRDFEFIWYPTPNNPDISIFTHVLDHHYSSPYLQYPNESNPFDQLQTGFDFEADPQQNPSINSSNIHERASILVEIIRQRRDLYRHSNVLLPFGNDFRYQDAELEFSNMDKLIEYINSNSSFGINLHYATLNEYFETVMKETNSSKDFFPELVNEDLLVDTDCGVGDYKQFNTCVAYWSGYYSTYPVLKGTARTSDSILRVGEILYSIASAVNNGFNDDFDFDIGYYALDFHRNVSGILTHHDATTGTSPLPTRENYFEMLYEAQNLTLNYNVPHFVGFLLANKTVNKDYKSDPTEILENAQDGDIVAVSFTNSLAWDRNEFVSIELPSTLNVAVYDSNFEPISSQLVERLDKNGKFYLYFQIQTPALGISTYFIVVLDSNNQISDIDLLNYISTNKQLKPIPSEITHQQIIVNDFKESTTITIGNSLYNLNFKFNSSYGNVLLLNSFDDLIRNQLSIPLTQNYIEYESYQDTYYEFIPKYFPNDLKPVNPQFYLTTGPLVSMVTVIYNYNCSQTFIVYNASISSSSNNSNNNNTLINDNQYFEIENRVASGWDKEIAIRFKSGIQNSNKFYSNNGLEMMKREYQIKFNDTHVWSLIAGNYYPVVTTGYIVDETNQLTLLTKQTVGGSSQSQGEFELLLLRKSNHTAWADLIMNDDSNPTIRLRVLFGEPNRIEQIRTPQSLIFENPLLPVYAKVNGGEHNSINIEKWLSIYNTIFKPLKQSLPYNIHLLTLSKYWMDSSINIFRILNIYEIDQNNDFSQPYNLSLNQLLSNFNIDNITEMTLSANQILSNENNNLTIKLNPIQLKTFLLNLNSK